jgi:hypothetical protein
MDSRQARAKEIQRAIGEVLLRNWDPLGVKDVPEAKDEYDSYVGGVYRLIASGASAKQIAEHLVRLETDRLGYPDTDPKMLIPLANKLLRLNVRLESGGSAA